MIRKPFLLEIIRIFIAIIIRNIRNILVFFNEKGEIRVVGVKIVGIIGVLLKKRL